MRWLTLLVAVALAASLPTGTTVAQAPEPLHIPHRPIVIDGPLGLSIGGHPNVANGVIGGDGSASNPFLISGWLFKYSEAVIVPVTAISIRNTGNAHILIQDNRIENVALAVEIENANNVAIDGNSVTTAGRAAILYRPARDITISNNTIHATGGIDVWGNSAGVRDVKIADNTFTSLANGDGIWLNGGTDIAIERNTITGFDQGRGMYCSGCSGVVANNVLAANDIGLRVASMVVKDNEIAWNRIGVLNTASSVVNGNNIHNNTLYGLQDTSIDGLKQDDFTDNWWGHADGPDGDYWDTPGQDATGVNLMEVFPWRTSPNPVAGP